MTPELMQLAQMVPTLLLGAAILLALHRLAQTKGRIDWEVRRTQDEEKTVEPYDVRKE